jgi:hypothetical protein
MTLRRAIQGVSASYVEGRQGERHGRHAALKIHPRGRQRSSVSTAEINDCTAARL